ISASSSSTTARGWRWSIATSRVLRRKSVTRCACASASRRSTASAISAPISGRRRRSRAPNSRRRAEAMASGIKDKAVILGMGCSQFGERWDMSSDMLMVEAFTEALADAGIEKDRIEAAWLGSALDDFNVGNSALPLATALRLRNIPVTRVENMCATGTDALRGAVYAVAAGAVDIAMALGVEKLKDT